MSKKLYLDKIEDRDEENRLLREKLFKEEKMSEPTSLVKESNYEYKDFKFDKNQEDLVDILVKRTGRNERGYFRILVAYKFAEMATHMRTKIEYLDSLVPANVYAIDLARSGFSKGRSINILDKQIFEKFRKKFEKKTMPSVTEINLQTLADLKAVEEGLDQNKADRLVFGEYENLPSFLYSFGSSTIEGFKALRLKLSMAEIGATSFVIDEIAGNMTANADALTAHLDAFDMGLTKQKLIKNDSNTEIYGAVPANIFMFGTQSKLFDGSKMEEDFFGMLEEGYGRRLLFGYVEEHGKSNEDLTPEELYDIATDTTTDVMIKTLSSYYEDLADTDFYNQTLKMDKEVAMLFLKYRQDCENEATTFKNHEEIKQAIVSHGYWKAVKLAGAYAFVSKSSEIKLIHAQAAIALVEESNRSFINISKRPTSYVKLINYMADVGREITQVELVENLPFYKGSEFQKKEMMTLALAHGYRNKIVVKKTYSDGVEFFKAERLDETSLDEIMVSWSTDITHNYKHHIGKWTDLPQMICEHGFHYTVNQWKDGHRNSNNLIEGFNICVLDVDNGTSIKAAKALLEEYEYIIYETKRSTPAHNRFRILIPLSHTLKLGKEDFKEFMENVFEYMPFNVDRATSDCARKWLSNKSTPIMNQGKFLDVYDFLPKTKKQEEMREASAKIVNADSVQKYFLLNHQDGRNNAALKYAFMLMDNGHSVDEVMLLVRDFNKKLVNPLSIQEIEGTIFKSIFKKEAEMELLNKS